LFFSRSLLVMALSLTMVLIGVNSQSGWMFWLAGLLLAALLVSWAASALQVRNLSLQRAHLSEVVEGSLLGVTLEVRNRGRLSRHLLEVIDEDPRAGHPRRKPRLRAPGKSLAEYLRDPSPPRGPSPSESGGRAAFLVPRIGGGETVTITYQRGGLRRGIYRDWPAYFYSEGIIGLSRHAARARVSSCLTVLPGYVELGSLPLVDSFLYPQRTLQEVSSKGGGSEFYGVREYRAGDPLRHVHWRTTARRGELVVREFEHETGAPLLILVDNRAEGGPEAAGEVLDSSARLAASVARYALHAGHPVAMAAARDGSLDTLRVRTFPEALRWLAALTPQGAAGLADQARLLGRELTPGCFLCCVTLAADLDREGLAHVLPPMCRVSLVLIDAGSHAADGRNRLPRPSPLQLLEALSRRPFAGLHSVSFYRKGEDIRKCLEEPLIIFADSMPPAR